MDNEEKKIPTPDIKDSPAEKPPVTNVDAEKKSEPAEKTEAAAETPAATDGSIVEIGPRIAGAVIDGIVASVLNIVGGMVFSFLGLGLWVAYILLKDALPFLDGQSIGKKVVGTKAVTESGQSLSGDFATSAKRNVWMLIAIVELIVLLIRQGKPEQGRRLGDDMAKTKVIKL